MNNETIQIGSVHIPLRDFAISGTAWLGIKKAGKTYGAKGVAEQLMDNGVPLIVFDAIGVWRYLKTPGAGSRAKGYNIVVAGGELPDVPLTPLNIEEIVRAAMRSNISLVIDLYDSKLSKADWRNIVQKAFHVLLFENKKHGRRYIILEETAEYAPQKVYDGETYAAVEKVVRMGGNVGLGIALINQRSQEVNKAVLDLCDNLVLMRQRGNAAIDAVQKWMDKVNPDDADRITASLPNLTNGKCWVWAENSDKPIETQTHKLRSYHPDRTESGQEVNTRPPVDTGEFVKTLLAELPKVIEEKKANDPAELRRTIAAQAKELGVLKTQLERAPKAVPTAEKVPALTDYERSRLTTLIEAFENLAERSSSMAEKVTEIGKQLEAQRAEITFFKVMLGEKLSTALPQRTPMVKPTVHRTPLAAPVIRRPVPPSDSDLGKGANEVLKAVAQHDDGVTDEQIAVLTGYKKTSRTTFKQQLFARGLIEKGGRGYVATTAGINHLGNDFEKLPVGDALREHWLTRLTGGELACFQVYVAAYPEEVTTEQLMEQTGYLKTSVTTFRQKLSARNLITGKKASANLFT